MSISSVCVRLLLHHVSELYHGVWVIVIIVEAGHFLVRHLARNVAFALLTAIQQVSHLLGDIVLEVCIITRYFHQVHEAIK